MVPWLYLQGVWVPVSIKIGLGIAVSIVLVGRPVGAVPASVFALQERSIPNGKGELVLSPVIEFVAQVRSEQFRNPSLPSDTEYRLFSQTYFKDRPYFLWRGDQSTGPITAIAPEKIPSLYGSLEAPFKSEDNLLPLPTLDLILATDQPIPVLKRKPVPEEALSAIDGLARTAFEKQGIPVALSKDIPRVWASAASVPNHPDTVVALYRRIFVSNRGGGTVRQVANLLLVAEQVTEKEQTAWQSQLTQISAGLPEVAIQYGPLVVADINGDNAEDVIVRETHFDRWSYGIYSYYQGKWQSRYSGGREGNYASDLPEPPIPLEEPTESP